MKQALNDYLVETISLIDPMEVPQLLAGIVSTLKKLPTGELASQVSDDMKELYEIYENRDEIFAGVKSPYKRAFYEAYLGTTISLAIIPTKFGKAGKYIKGKKDSETIQEIKKLKNYHKAKLVGGYYEVGGFKFSKYYYEKLWKTGRGAPGLTCKEILSSYKTKTKDSKKGFLKYETDDWEMVFNPTTKEVWHLQPKK